MKIWMIHLDDKNIPPFKMDWNILPTDETIDDEWKRLGCYYMVEWEEE